MRVTKVLSVIFGMLAVCGATYIFYTSGRANAGYAVVPMIFSLFFSQWTRSIRIKHKQTK